MYSSASAMSEFQSVYKKCCKTMSITPLPCVTEACARESTVLNLSGNCLTPEHCSVIGKCLQRRHNFVEANFSDCLMGDEGKVQYYHLVLTLSETLPHKLP